MSFWDKLGETAKTYGQNVIDRSLPGDIYSRYQAQKSQEGIDAAGEAAAVDPAFGMSPSPGMDAISQMNESAGLDDLSKPGSGLTAGQVAGEDHSGQWTQSQPAAAAGGGGLAKMAINAAIGAAFPGAAEGRIVTEPTIVRLGEREPEMVIPLNGRAGNKTSPAAMGSRYQSCRGGM
jgi:hypothetical protein